MASETPLERTGMSDARKPGPPTSDLTKAIDELADTIDCGHLLAATDPAEFLRTAKRELESTREACRVAVAAQAQEDDEIEALRAEIERLKRWEAAAMIVDTKKAQTQQSKLASMIEAAKPLVRWINNNCNPHATIIVTSGSVELLSGEMSAPIEEFWKD